LRLAYFHPKFTEVGGAELLALKHADLLRQGGIEVVFVTFSVKGSFWESAFRGWPLHLVPKRDYREFIGGWSRLSKLNRRASRALPFLQGFDLVFATNHPCCTMLGQYDIPAYKVWYCHEPPRNLFPRETLPYGTAALARLGPSMPALLAIQQEIRKVEGILSPYRAVRIANLAAIPHINHRLFNSRFTLANAKSAYGSMEGEVLYPIIHFPEARHPRKGLDRDKVRLLVQSRLTPLKNLETVIDGFKQFRLAHPKAELHILGSGPSMADLQVRAGTGPGAGGAFFHGFLSHDEVHKLRAHCNVFGLLPLDEPFGMVYPEVAAEGLLLVGPDHGGPREILQDGDLGWLCEALSPSSFRDALEAICQSSDADLNLIRDKADLACRSRFSPSVLGPQLLSEMCIRT
jgi:glycosyltransferase involved in cell wall biosynthesis